jgi:ferredoxin-nitrite reductase
LSRSNPSEINVCPALFYATPAKDGKLFRLRVPSGILTGKQCSIVAEFAEELAEGKLQVTNRSNLQFRTKIERIPANLSQKLQTFGLAAENERIDRLRNIMLSPTAGIDCEQLIDTRPFAAELAVFIENNSDVANLPPKFSVGFAGGEKLTIVDRTNELLLAARQIEEKIYFHLILNSGKGKSTVDAGILLTPQQCLPIIKAAIEVYLEAIEDRSWWEGLKLNTNKPRLRDILNILGADWYLDRIFKYLSFVPKNTINTPEFLARENSIAENPLIGVYPQRQAGLFYLGINLPLGSLAARQMKKLAQLVSIYGDGELRLTPWQSLLIGNVTPENLIDLQQEIAELDLNCQPEHPYNGMVACAGNTGCAKSATNTQQHALVLAKYLEKTIDRKCSSNINIHFTGCPKSCAQTNQADITLLGKTIQQDDRLVEAYQIYTKGEGESKFGRLIAENIRFDEINNFIQNSALTVNS